MTSTAACLILAGGWILFLAVMIGLAWDSGRGDKALERDQADRLLGMRAHHDFRFRPVSVSESEPDAIQLFGGPEDEIPRPVRRSPMQGETKPRRTGR